LEVLSLELSPQQPPPCAITHLCRGEDNSRLCAFCAYHHHSGMLGIDALCRQCNNTPCFFGTGTMGDSSSRPMVVFPQPRMACRSGTGHSFNCWKSGGGSLGTGHVLHLPRVSCIMYCALALRKESGVCVRVREKVITALAKGNVCLKEVCVCFEVEREGEPHHCRPRTPVTLSVPDDH
jgi:hypothetical protein